MENQKRTQKSYAPGTLNRMLRDLAVKYVWTSGDSFKNAERMYGIPRSTIQATYSKAYGPKPKTTHQNVEYIEGIPFDVFIFKDAQSINTEKVFCLSSIIMLIMERHYYFQTPRRSCA